MNTAFSVSLEIYCRLLIGLQLLIHWCQEWNTKLNKDKMGHVILEGLKADLKKIKAVLEMLTPTDVASVRRFIGLMNNLSKFLLG